MSRLKGIFVVVSKIFDCRWPLENLSNNDGIGSKISYPVIWKIVGLFSSPISREIDHP